MAHVEMMPEVADDFDRILAYLSEHQNPDPTARVMEIIHAIDVLTSNPLIGRPVSNERRELVIGRKGSGYAALYRYLDKIDTVFVLAVRSQREAGYARET